MGTTRDNPAALDRLIERSAELKAALLEFAELPRYGDELEDAFEDRLGDNFDPDDGATANAYDHFFFQHRMADGRTFVEHFVEKHPELPMAEREMLLSWRGVVEGIFAATARDGAELVLDNLVDELTYRTRSNKGPAALDVIQPGAFIIARVIPVGDRWVLSGSLQIFPKANRLRMYQIAAEMTMLFPRFAFRNPDKLAEAWRIQREDQAAFVAHFGGDTVVVPGTEAVGVIRRFRRFQTFEWRGEDGQTGAERAAAQSGETPDPDELDADLDAALGADLGTALLEAETVGIIYDETDGLNFFPDYAMVAEAFARPEVLADENYESVVAEYLEEPDIPPLPLLRLAEQHPTHVNQVFRVVLQRPDFSWRREGENLLRLWKSDYYAEEPIPAVAPLSDTLANALRQDPAALRKVGRNDPCPCGSGKKYKRCCGAA